MGGFTESRDWQDLERLWIIDQKDEMDQGEQADKEDHMDHLRQEDQATSNSGIWGKK